MLKLNGIDVHVSGVAGHFIGSDDCSLRMSWRIDDIRISTVGGYAPPISRARTHAYETIGSGRYWETFVFEVFDDGTPAGTSGDTPIWTTAGPGSDTRDAEAMHYRVARAVAEISRHGIVEPAAVTAALSSSVGPGGNL